MSDLGAIMDYRVKRIRIYNIPALYRISVILKACGDDMYEKYGLTHWKNSLLKSFLIALYTALQNKVYGVYGEKQLLGTFQVRKKKNSLHFSKLAVLPSVSGKGVGSFCLDEISGLAKAAGLNLLRCEVYDKSERARVFYEHHGFVCVGKIDTIKYNELVLEKSL